MGDEEEDMDAEEESSEPAEEVVATEETDDEVEENSNKSAAEQMREYVEKVAAPSNNDTADNKKSTVAGKNDMGGTASNLAQGGEGETKGTAGGLANPSTKEENAGNVNVPGGKAGKSMKAMPKGHGSEKKGAGETADNKKPIIGG